MNKELNVIEFYYLYILLKEAFPIIKIVGMNVNDATALALDDLTKNLAEECSICLTNKNEVALPGCGHAFCKSCLKDWGQKSQNCPMCVE